MKTVVSIVLLLSVLECFGQEISNVTVFNDRAFVTRRMSLALNKGVHRLVIESVTPILDRDSIKILVSHDDIKILGSKVVDQYALLREKASLKHLLERKSNIEKEISKLMDDSRIGHKEFDALRDITQHAEQSFVYALNQKKWNKRDLSGLLSLLKSRSNKLHGTWKELYDRFSKLSIELEFVAQKIAQEQRLTDKHNVDIIVELEVLESIQAQMEVQYLVGQVTWWPTYDLRLNHERNRASLEMSAMVSQHSGEDWTNVSMTISNHSAELNPILPQISSYQLGYREVDKVKTKVASQEKENLVLQNNESNVSNQAQLMEEFKISNRQNLKHGSINNKIFIVKTDMPYREQLEVVPSSFPRAYYRATLKNQFNWPLQDGPLAIWHDEALLQETYLDAVAKGGSFAINSGLEDAIRVEFIYNDVTTDKGLGQFLDKKFSRKYGIKLYNDAATAKKLKILLQVPQSQLESVKVNVQDETPGLAALTDHPSWRYWEKNLEPMSKTELEAKVSVTVPKDFDFSW